MIYTQQTQACACVYECTKRIQHNNVHVRIELYAIYLLRQLSSSVYTVRLCEWAHASVCVPLTVEVFVFFLYFVEWCDFQFSVVMPFAIGTVWKQFIHTDERTNDNHLPVSLTLDSTIQHTPSIKSRSEFMMWNFFPFANQTRKCILIFNRELSGARAFPSFFLCVCVCSCIYLSKYKLHLVDFFLHYNFISRAKRRISVVFTSSNLISSIWEN